MKILSIGTDRTILTTNSRAQDRQIAYSTLFEETHIILYSKKTGKGKIQLSENCWVYPTNSRLRLLYFLNALRIGFSILKSKSDFIITTQDPADTGIVGVMLSIFFKVPLHIQLHTEINSPHFFSHSLANKIRTFLSFYTLRFATSIRVVSQRIKEQLTTQWKIPEKKICVQPICVEVLQEKTTGSSFSVKEKYPGFDYYLLVVSRLEREKNVALALNATAELTRRGKNPALLILGSGSLKNELETTAHNLSISSRVFFEGHQESLAPYYQSADLLLLTSYYEGFGMVLLEAAKASLRMVSTDVGIARELGVMIAKPTATDFADMIEHTLSAPPQSYQIPPYVVSDWREYLNRYQQSIISAANR